MSQPITGAAMNTNTPGIIKANASNIYGYSVDSNQAFITLTFKALKTSHALDACMLLDEFALVDSVEPTTVEPTTTPVTVMLSGDANGDGVITVDDSTLVQKCIADLAILTPKQIEVADVNHDGIVNVVDATMIRKYVAEIIDHFGA